MTCQIVKDTMERVKQGGMGKEEFAFNGDRWKVLMSDTPSSTHTASLMWTSWPSGEEFLCKAQELEWIV